MRKGLRLGVLLCLWLLCFLQPGCNPSVPVTAPADTTALPKMTTTPFQPVPATATAAAPVPVAENFPPRGTWHGIDFTDTRQRILVEVDAPELPVQVDFEDRTAEISLPVFRPA